MFRAFAPVVSLLTTFLLPAAAQSKPSADCPLPGAVFPTDFDPASGAAFQKALASFPNVLDTLVTAEAITPNVTTFSLDLFSTRTNESIFSYHHEAEALNATLSGGVLDEDTIYRIGSVTKLYTVYIILAYSQTGLRIFDTPVTDYIPELGGNDTDSNVDRIRWEDITIGALARQQSGAGGAPSDLIISYLDPDIPDLTEQDFFTIMRDQKRPVTPVFDDAMYSDGGFSILGLLVQRLTGMSYDEALRTVLAEPLGFTSTTAKIPEGDDVNGIIVDESVIGETGWGLDSPLSVGSGGIYSTLADLRATALAISHSALLPEDVTRAWMKPTSHTGTLVASIGAPWEIYRLGLPVGANRTRISDIYTKGGGNPGYGTVFALAPDQEIGFNVLTAGEGTGAARFILRNAMLETFLVAIEADARAHAAENYAGTFADPEDGSTNITLSVEAGRLGLGLESWYQEGVSWVANITGPGAPLSAAEELSFRLYPMALEDAPDGHGEGCPVIASFRAAQGTKEELERPAVLGGMGGLMEMPGQCEPWLTTGFLWTSAIGGTPDNFLFEVVDGRLESVTNEVAGVKMVRAG